MKIIYFAYRKTAPSFRYRGKYILAYLHEKNNISYKVIYPVKSSYLKLVFFIIRNILVLDRHTIYVFQKITKGNGLYSMLLKTRLKTAKNSFYDMDDAMHLIRSEETIRYYASNVDAVTVGSKALCNYFKKINLHTYLLTTPVIPPFARKKSRNETLTVGWIGIFKVHKDNLLKIFFPALKKFETEIRLVLLGVQTLEQYQLVCDYFKDNPNISIEMPLVINWDAEEETLQRISEFDIGVMPLIDNEMNRCRSAFKIKQYLSVGIPVIASPVGENKKYVTDGHNGFLCKSVEEWERKIHFLNDLEGKEYEKFSHNAYNSYLNYDFTLKEVSEKFLNLATNAKHQH